MKARRSRETSRAALAELLPPVPALPDEIEAAEMAWGDYCYWVPGPAPAIPAPPPPAPTALPLLRVTDLPAALEQLGALRPMNKPPQ